MSLLLLAALFFPILISPLFWVLQRRNFSGISVVAYVVAAIEIGLVGLSYCLVKTAPVLHPVVQLPWIPDLGIYLSFGWDRFTQMMTILTVLVVPFVIGATSVHRSMPNKGYFYALLFVLETALIGVYAGLDLFGFYVFWELSLIPAYFMVLCWGGDGIAKVTLKFFVYTFAGSLLMLLAFVYLFINTKGTHSLLDVQMAASQMGLGPQIWICLALMVAFAIKTPIFPFHTWQPDTYQKAAFPVSMVLGGLLSKLGIVGIFKILIPGLPLAMTYITPYVMVIALIGMVYGAAMALVQTDLKRMIAYASLSHLGLLVAGVLSLTIQGFQGAMFQIVAHSVTTLGMFFVAQLLFDKVGTTQLAELGGLNSQNRLFSASFFILLLAMVGFPLTIGFVGEFLLVWGLATGPILPFWLGPIAVSTLVFGAWYMLRMYHAVMYGDPKPGQSIVLNMTEKALLSVLLLTILTFGIIPKPVMTFSNQYIHQIVEASNSQ